MASSLERVKLGFQLEPNQPEVNSVQLLQPTVDQLRIRYLTNKKGSPNYISLIEIKQQLLALGIDSVETAIELGVRFNTVIYSRGWISLREFIILALAAEPQAEEKLKKVPEPGQLSQSKL